MKKRMPIPMDEMNRKRFRPNLSTPKATKVETVTTLTTPRERQVRSMSRIRNDENSAPRIPEARREFFVPVYPIYENASAVIPLV